MKVGVAEHLRACERRSQFPKTGLPEVAFLGRSNVGKSSLLNALAHRKKLAHTSATPGKTRAIHFYRVEIGTRELVLVDLPGYGWAKVSRRERAAWQSLIEGYLGEREELALAILLQDVRRDVSEDETLLLDWLAERDVPAMVAVTKADKLKQGRRKQRLAELRRQLGHEGLATVATSSQSRSGIDDLWRAIHERIPAWAT